MLCRRCVLPFLALYGLLEEISAAALMTRNTRELNWLELGTLQHQDDHLNRDLSVGDAAKMGQDPESLSTQTQIETPPAPTQHTATQHQRQFQYIRQKNDKRRKVIPLDSIGRFQMADFHNRKDELEVYRDVYRP